MEIIESGFIFILFMFGGIELIVALIWKYINK